MKVLLLGSTGQLGQALQAIRPEHVALIVAGRDQVDFANPEAVEGFVSNNAADLIINAAAFAICFRAFGLAVPPEAALLLQGIIGFGVAIPSTPSFLGVFEAATLVTLQLYGVDSNLAVSYALTYHVTTFLPITLLGLWSLSRLHIRLRELSRAAKEGTA